MTEQPKLRTYEKFKTKLRMEDYLEMMDSQKRIAITKMRSGTNPLRIETGRWEGEQPWERVCSMCDKRVVEDESHFMLQCPAYKFFRRRLREKITSLSGTSILSLSTTLAYEAGEKENRIQVANEVGRFIVDSLQLRIE